MEGFSKYLKWTLKFSCQNNVFVGEMKIDVSNNLDVYIYFTSLTSEVQVVVKEDLQ